MTIAASATALVSFCARRAWVVVMAALVMAAAAVAVIEARFAINTDPVKLMSPRLEWRQREIDFDKAFPQRPNVLVAVLEGATPELAETGAAALNRALLARPDLVRSVRRPDAGPYIEENGLLFLSAKELESTTNDMVRVQPLLAILAADPSLRGVIDALRTALQGLEDATTDPDTVLRALGRFTEVIEQQHAGQPPPFSWRGFIANKPAKPEELRRLIVMQPRLDFSALEPGRAASEGIRALAHDIGIRSDAGLSLRLTGPIALADEEFATVAEGAGVNAAITLLLVILLLRLALRSGRLIVAVTLNLLAGLLYTGAAGLALVGEFNLISVAFAVLFVGLGVDFGIQFGVRWREVRLGGLAPEPALGETGRQMAAPLALAATSVAAGFYAFLPTDYRGLSELGFIAGSGMIIALFTTLTLLPALMRLLSPNETAAAVGFPALARLDRLFARRRGMILFVSAALVLISLAAMSRLRFDANPLNLRNMRTESVATLLSLGRDAIANPGSVDILRPNVEDAAALAKRLAGLPAVERATTLMSFVPEEQADKLAIMEDVVFLLDPSLNPADVKPSPGDGDILAAIGAVREKLRQSMGQPGIEVIGPRLERALAALAAADPALRDALAKRLVAPLEITLGQMRAALRARAVTLEDLPADLVADWRAADGRVRIEVVPKGDPTDTVQLTGFSALVLARAPDASGGAITVTEAGRTVVRAFIEAAVIAFVLITAILWLMLRRLFDVAWTVLPLLASGLLTLLAAVLIDLPLNFANIIALPLMFGVGVAFHIYYVIAWREGVGEHMQSSLTRAILFSALTTAVAFGSLWLSSHPGTASMGQLLAVSLGFTLLTAFVIVPACLGPPRRGDHTKSANPPSTAPEAASAAMTPGSHSASNSSR